MGHFEKGSYLLLFLSCLSVGRKQQHCSFFFAELEEKRRAGREWVGSWRIEERPKCRTVGTRT